MSAISDKPDSSTPPRRKSWGQAIAGRLIEVCIVLLILGGLFLLIWPSCRMIFEAADGMQSSNNLKLIGLAIHNYNDTNGELPTNTYAPDGTPLLSWRVHLLPYLEGEQLHREFKLDEPWDSPHNRKLLDRMPEIYRDPRTSRESGNQTHYRGFSNPGAVFEQRPPRSLAVPLLGGPIADLKTRFSLDNLKGPLSETILVVEASDAVEWTKPDDLDASPGKPFPMLGGMRRQKEYFGAAMGDGSARRMRVDTDESVLRAMISHSGGEKVPGE